MLLPESLLQQLSFYEETNEKILDKGVFTKVTLHFKAWYRIRKVIRIRWTSHFDNQNQTIQHTETIGSIELRDQLRAFFMPKPPLLDPLDRTIRSVK